MMLHLMNGPNNQPVVLCGEDERRTLEVVVIPDQAAQLARHAMSAFRDFVQGGQAEAAFAKCLIDRLSAAYQLDHSQACAVVAWARDEAFSSVR